MNSITDRLKGIAWYKWVLTACVFLYLTYLSLSGFYLPGKLKRLTETDISTMIGREISVEKISFNPFTLSLSADNFSISEKDKTHLVAWDQLVVNLGFWRSVFSWGIALDQFYLESPSIKIRKDKEGFNFNDIIERLSASDSKTKNPQDKKGEGGSISIKINNTSIKGGNFSYADVSGRARAGIDLDDISLSVEELYFATGDEHLNPFNLKAKGPRGSRIELAGSYRVDPLHVEGNIRADGVGLSYFSGFLENIIPVKLSSGILSFGTDILVTNDTRFILKTEKGNISIDDLAIDDSVPEPSMLSADKIDVQDFSFDLTGQKVTVERVLLNEIVLNQWLDENGRPRYEGLFPAEDQEASAEKVTPSDDTQKTPWDIMIKQVSLKNSTINFDDLNEKITRGHSLAEINIDINDISLAPESRIPVRLSAMLDEKGGINVEGFLSPSPFSMEMTYQLDKLLLNPFSEYLETASWLSIENGSLSVDGKLSISEGEKPSINAAASLGVDDFMLRDSRSGKPVFGLKAFRLDDINAEVDKQMVSIADVSILKPDFSITMSDKKEFNLSGLMKEKNVKTAPDTPEEATDKSPGWKFEISKVSMSDGTLLFSDNSIKPSYKTGLYNMTFSLDKIGSDINKPAPFSFKTEIDKYAPFTITGTLDPVDRQPGFAFNSMLKGLDMPQLSPYSGVYIGNNLKSGKLSLNLDYALHDRKLKGKNNINAKNLYLGEKLPVEPVVNAPVGLGLALLRDLSGVIDLDVGVSGDLDDPGFSVTGVIVKALVNIIVKAAASPFKLLGALIPGGGDDLGNIAFDPGSTALNQANKDSLKNLVDALNKRPQLILSIRGNASGREDIEALKIMKLKNLAAEKRAVALPVIDQELLAQDFWMTGANRPVLETISNDMGLPSVAERMKEALSAGNAETQDETGNQDTSLAEQKVYKQVYDDIIAGWKIEEDELLSLADERALSIKQYLVDDLKLSHERVSVIKSIASDLSGRIITLGVDAM